jgi:hypothetical protein
MSFTCTHAAHIVVVLVAVQLGVDVRLGIHLVLQLVEGGLQQEAKKGGSRREMQEAVLRYLSWAREAVSEGWYFGASRKQAACLGVLEDGVHCSRYPAMLLGIVQTLRSISKVQLVTMCCSPRLPLVCMRCSAAAGAWLLHRTPRMSHLCQLQHAGCKRRGVYCKYTYMQNQGLLEACGHSSTTPAPA